MAPLTQRQINALKVLAKGRPIVASWNHRDLSPMAGHYVHGEIALQVTGKASSNYIWTITDEGRRLLEEERAGQ